MSVLFGLILVLTNAMWAIVYWRREKTIEELGKLIASRTLSEYSWLKAAEEKQAHPPQKEAKEDYENLWENDDG